MGLYINVCSKSPDISWWSRKVIARPHSDFPGVNLMSLRNSTIDWKITLNFEEGVKNPFLFCTKRYIFLKKLMCYFDVISTAASFETNTEEILQTFLENKKLKNICFPGLAKI
jgi:hypothetical protein